VRHFDAISGFVSYLSKFNVASNKCKDKFCRESDTYGWHGCDGCLEIGRLVHRSGAFGECVAIATRDWQAL
jgi:hypothetical protein